MRKLAIVATILLAIGTTSTQYPRAAGLDPACGIDLRVLVVAADGHEADFPAIKAALEYLGVPYHVFVAAEHPEGLSASALSTGCHANYQGVILTTNELGWASPNGWASAFTPADFETLAAFESHFGLRQVNWFTYPRPDAGFNWISWPADVVNPSPTPLNATLTPAGASVFSYLAPGVIVPIQYATAYLATPIDSSTTPLLVDGQGHAIAAVSTGVDGRETLAMTVDSNPYLRHSMLLSYGVVNWLTRGLFIGERHVTMSPQVDDVFIDNTHWAGPSAAGEGTSCGTPVDDTGGTARMTGADLNAVVRWQNARRLDPAMANFRLTMAFNGIGTTGLYAGDTLTDTARRRQAEFNWVSHTWDHESLDVPMDYAAAQLEVSQNNTLATSLGLARYSVMNLVQPNVSGLENSAALQALADSGVRYVVSDSSRPGQDNPAPNLGSWNALDPRIFQIPRRPNNLFFNVVRPADWVAEYNCMYRAYWGGDKTYPQVLDLISDELLTYLLKGELDPWMFHQPNLIAYDGTHSLLTDVLDATVQKYRSHFALPIQTPPMQTVGIRMANRTLAATYGISGTIRPGSGITLTSPVDVTVPVTGLKTTGSETYGGQSISWITLRANTPRFVAMTSTPGLQAPIADAGVASQRTISLAPVTLAGSGVDGNTPARPLTFAWTQTSGPAVVLSSTSSPVATFVAPVLAPGVGSATLNFRLTVSNGVFAASDTTSVVVKAPKAPNVKLSSSFSVSSGAAVAMTASAQDLNQPPLPLVYSWAQTSGPAVALSSPSAASTSFVAPTLAARSPSVKLGFTLTVSNGLAQTTASTLVTVTAPRR